MFALFNIGVQEIIILAVLGVVVVAVLFATGVLGKKPGPPKE